MIILNALGLLYIAHHTFSYAKVVWQEGNKLAGVFITILGVIIIIIPIGYMLIPSL